MEQLVMEGTDSKDVRNIEDLFLTIYIFLCFLLNDSGAESGR